MERQAPGNAENCGVAASPASSIIMVPRPNPPVILAMHSTGRGGWGGDARLEERTEDGSDLGGERQRCGRTRREGWVEGRRAGLVGTGSKHGSMHSIYLGAFDLTRNF